MVEALAQRVDAIQNGTHPSGVAGRASPDQFTFRNAANAALSMTML